MNELFSGLIERAHYYEQFENFCRSLQIVHYKEYELCEHLQV